MGGPVRGTSRTILAGEQNDRLRSIRDWWWAVQISNLRPSACNKTFRGRFGSPATSLAMSRWHRNKTALFDVFVTGIHAKSQIRMSVGREKPNREGRF